MDREKALTANLTTYSTEQDERAYEEVSPHLKHDELTRLLDSLFIEALGSGHSVLDCGAGPGHKSLPWLGHGLDITAVDSSERMLAQYRRREPAARTVVAEVTDWLASSHERFDLVVHVSMLHHVPDYLGLLKHSVRLVARGGSLLTFQDPLLYARQPRLDRAFEVVSYFTWRLFQGSYRRGAATILRRATKGLGEQPEDNAEYHVVRGGVDMEAIVELLRPHFSEVRELTYWSTQGRVQQWLGRRVGLRSTFAVLAKERRP